MSNKLIEYIAINILNEVKEINKYNYENIDKPDWFNKKDQIGIEITNSNQSIAFYELIKGVNSEKDIKNLKKFNKQYKKNGGCVITEKENVLNYNSQLKLNNGYIYIPPDIDDSFIPINKVIKTKLEKLEHYKRCNDNRLFIFSVELNILTSEAISDSELNKELNYLLTIKNEYKYNYKIVYIFSIGKMYVFNLEKENYHIIELENIEEILKKTLKEIT